MRVHRPHLPPARATCQTLIGAPQPPVLVAPPRRRRVAWCGARPRPRRVPGVDTRTPCRGDRPPWAGRLQPRCAPPSGTTARGRGAGGLPLARPGAVDRDPATAHRPHTVRTRGDSPPKGQTRRTVGDPQGRQTRGPRHWVAPRGGRDPARPPLQGPVTCGDTGGWRSRLWDHLVWGTACPVGVTCGHASCLRPWGARALINCFNTGSQKAHKYREMCSENMSHCMYSAQSMQQTPLCPSESTSRG
jgi:hypothetical protein